MTLQTDVRTKSAGINIFLIFFPETFLGKKKKKKISGLSSAEFSQKVVKVKPGFKLLQ